MTEAVLQFTRIVAWSAVLWCTLIVALVTASKWRDGDFDLYPDKWKSRTTYAVIGGIAAAWLYATWGL